MLATTTQPRLGLMALPATWAEARQQAAWADDLGFDSLWTGDHLRHPRLREFPFLDGWSVLAAWAATTRRVRLGLLVNNMIYREPVVAVRHATAVDAISGGRFTLGLGAGVYPTDHAMAGVPAWEPSERIGRMTEYLTVVDGLLRDTLGDFAGRHYRTSDAVLRPLSQQQPRLPLLVAALRPRMIALAVQYAETWNTFGGFDLDDDEHTAVVARQVEAVRRECDRQGRDLASLTLSLCAYPPLTPWRDRGELDRLLDTYASLGFDELVVYAPTPAERSVFEHVMATRAARSGPR